MAAPGAPGEAAWPAPQPAIVSAAAGPLAPATATEPVPCNWSLLCANSSDAVPGAGANASAGPPDDLAHAIVVGVTSVVLGLIILITVIGNVFVIAAILLERNLQSVANYLIVSLAVADLMVACLVMPLGAVYEISKGWILGPELCDMWTSSDVLCCTASILHLVAIAVDRYWAVTNVDYIHTRNSARIGGMIVVVWAVALIVSLAPQFGWKDPEYLDRINLQQRCLVSQDIAYQVFATCSTFYVPLLVILVLYWKIFQTARKRIHRRRRQQRAAVPSLGSGTGADAAPTPASGAAAIAVAAPAARRFLCKRRLSPPSKKVSTLTLVEGQSTPSIDASDDQDVTRGACDNGVGERTPPLAGTITTAFTISKGVDDVAAGGKLLESGIGVPDTVAALSASNNISPEKSSATTTTNNGSASHQSHMSDVSRIEILHKEAILQKHGSTLSAQEKTAASLHRKDKKESLEAKRERKAAKTLAIITGAFVVCWLPFFIMALLLPLCETCYISDSLQSFFLWLGYFNSTLNPVIYTIFSPEFRQAFKRILCGTGRSRSRKIR